MNYSQKVKIIIMESELFTKNVVMIVRLTSDQLKGFYAYK